MGFRYSVYFASGIRSPAAVPKVPGTIALAVGGASGSAQPVCGRPDDRRSALTRSLCNPPRSELLNLQLLPTMWPPAHAIAELSMVLGFGATGAGLIQLRYIEGRITLAVGVSLLLCCAAAGGFS
jgi:hypothetical protein